MPILNRLEKQIYIMCGLPNTVLEENRKSALAQLQRYKNKKYKEKWDDYFKCHYQCEWIEEDNTKWNKDYKN